MYIIHSLVVTHAGCVPESLYIHHSLFSKVVADVSWAWLCLMGLVYRHFPEICMHDLYAYIIHYLVKLLPMLAGLGCV